MKSLDALKEAHKAAAIQFDRAQKRLIELGDKITAMENEPPKIDFSKIPVDTLVEVRDRSHGGFKNFFKGMNGSGYDCFQDGKTSLREHTANWRHIRLINNPPKPWFGGECPLPDGVCVKLWRRNRTTDCVEATSQDWSHRSASSYTSEVIAYQILESEWQS